jgi:hypothetical protein
VFFSYTDLIIISGVVLLVGKAQQFLPLFCNPGNDSRHPGTGRSPGKDDPDSGREEGPGRVSRTYLFFAAGTGPGTGTTRTKGTKEG